MSRVLPLASHKVRTRQGMTRRQRREALAFYLLVSPFVIGFLGLTLVPMLTSFYVSFTQWDIVSVPRWIGLANYQHLFTSDADFVQGIKVTLSYAAVALPLGLIATFTLAMMMNQGGPLINVFRALYYIPSLLAGVSVAALWVWVLDAKGVLNNFLSFVGLPAVGWLTDPNWALRSFVIMGLWTAGSGVLIYLAGLKGIPQQLYEAAEIDGAGWWARFFQVTIPLLTPTIFFNLVTALIGVFQYFDQSYIMTRGGPPIIQGGQIVGSTEFYMIKLYNDAFSSSLYGKAAAEACILFVFILICTLIVFKTSRSWVFYEGDVVKGK